MSGDVLERIDLEVATVLAMKGPLQGETLRFMRKALGLRGFELAALLGVTGETLSRWEHEQRPVDSMAWILVGSLVLEHAGRPPVTLRRLLAANEKKPTPLPKTVRLRVDERARTRTTKTKTARVA
jgi:transcriptional regulator with XRE-family HTH domain